MAELANLREDGQMQIENPKKLTIFMMGDAGFKAL